MPNEVHTFLQNKKLSVLAVALQDGMPHASTVHFSYQENPFKIFVGTDRAYKKCAPLLGGAAALASIVVGTDEGEMKTLQMDGTVRIVTDVKELSAIKEVHYTRIPSAKKWDDDPNTVFLEFVPTWWRYIDYTTNPETRVESGNEEIQ